MIVQEWIGRAALAGALMLSTGCPKPMEIDADSGPKAEGANENAQANNAGGGGGSNPGSGTFAIPQESLQRDPTALKISGTISIEGYEAGLIQLDVTRLNAGNGNVQPVTIARYTQPGPFELFVPKGTESIYIYGFLDVKGDGPTFDDPRGEYTDNPLEMSGEAVTGLNIVIDLANTQAPPPEDQQGDGDKSAEPGSGEGDRATDATQGDGQPKPDSAEPQGDGQPKPNSAEPQGDGQPKPDSAEPQGDGQPKAAPAIGEGPPPTPKPAAGAAKAVPDMLSEDND